MSSNNGHSNGKSALADERPPPDREPAADVEVQHDIYFLSPDQVLHKFPVDADGRYRREPQTPSYSEANLRHIHNLADPGLTEAQSGTRGPVFATLPVTREPTAASFGWCYVINPNNLIYRNAYTAEEWFAPDAPEQPAPTIPDEFELIVGGPKGRIYHMEVTDGGETARCRLLKQEELTHETDVWDQLRNGTVVGRVLYRERVVPLVNVTSVQCDGGRS